jgi:hypothetical protein
MSPALDIDAAGISNALQKNYPNFTPLRKFLCLFGWISFILEGITLALEGWRDRGREKTTLKKENPLYPTDIRLLLGSTTEILGEFLTDSLFYIGIRWNVPADGLVEEVAVEIEGGFD